MNKKQSSDIETLESKLGYSFGDRSVVLEALTHRSYAHEKKNKKNYERLEFLGDAVLDLIVGEYLFKKFRNFDEGKLSKMRASLVNEEGFTSLANHLNLGEFIYLSNAEENNNGRSKSSLLSNAFEAVMGAMYLETGLGKVEEITIALLEHVHPDISLDSLFKDYKTSLQELTQAHYGTTPEYQLIAAHGPDHKKEFEVAVVIDGKRYASAQGKSKKQA